MHVTTARAVDSQFQRQILEACFDAFELAGFTRFRKRGVDWPLSNAFHCWFGLNCGLSAHHLNINPFVGVHVVPIEKMWTSVKRGEYAAKYDRGVATYAIHSGELVPNEPIFRFAPESSARPNVERLVRLYEDFGKPFSQSIAQYHRLLPLLRERAGTLGGNPERLACCLYLMGMKDEARSVTQSFLASHERYFEGFAVPFLEKLTRERVN